MDFGTNPNWIEESVFVRSILMHNIWKQTYGLGLSFSLSFFLSLSCSLTGDLIPRIHFGTIPCVISWHTFHPDAVTVIQKSFILCSEKKRILHAANTCWISLSAGVDISFFSLLIELAHQSNMHPEKETSILGSPFSRVSVFWRFPCLISWENGQATLLRRPFLNTQLPLSLDPV